QRFFEGLDLHYVEGSEILYHNSFPSGHTMTAFALFFLVAQLVKQKAWGLGFAGGAIAVGMSRVYLLKHFFLDVCIGGSIGIAIGLLVHFVVMPVAEKWNYKLTHRGIQRLDT
ncbi:MAG TPA: phosphatase PAP2 family protein, partial [Chitinophagales bacterium]|nr:phosphatase PAP2 family protein [Chitinophagales bacterium]